MNVIIFPSTACVRSWDIPAVAFIAGCSGCYDRTAMRCISGTAAAAPPTANSDIRPKVEISAQIGFSLFTLLPSAAPNM